MGVQRYNKINHILQSWPKGTVASTKWFQKNGISRNLLAKYAQSGWVQRIGSGAATRSGDRVGWEGAVYALQKQLGLTVHPGSKTALALHGASHTIPLGSRQKVYLVSRSAEHLPKWFASGQWNAEISIQRVNLFGDDLTTGISEMKFGEFELCVSSRERAMFELLYTLRGDAGVEEVWNIMLGLVTLRPAVAQTLLERCTSIKVKRLFAVLAEETEQPWLPRVDLSGVDFGTGKRVFAFDGYLHPRYGITVPRSWQRGREML